MVGIEVEEASAILLAHTKPKRGIEALPLLTALGRVAAEDILAPMDNPPFDRSPLDGYSFIAQDSEAATEEVPIKFAIVGEVCAGQNFQGQVKAGQAIRIMTGAKIPANCDCVVRQESVKANADTLYITVPMKRHENYCFKGEDIQQGKRLIQASTLLTAVHIGVLASMGFTEVAVYKLPRIAICSTGDEIAEVGQTLSEGQIYNSNLYLLAARLSELGFSPILLGAIKDNALSAAQVIKENIGDVDLFLTTGGVSVGKKDILHEVIDVLNAKRLFWRVNMKPGTPVLSYQYEGKLCIGLSGNPFAALATFELLVRPVLAKLSRSPIVNYRRTKAVLVDSFSKESSGRRLIRAYEKDGKVFLPSSHHASGSLFSAAGCNCMIDIPKGTLALTPGMQVEIVK